MSSSTTRPNILTIGRLRFGLVVALALVVANAVTLYTSIADVQEHRHRVARTDEVVRLLDLAISDLKDVETGQRGFSLTGEEPFLDPYHAGRKAVGERLVTLKTLTAEDAQQQVRMGELARVVSELLAYEERVVEVRRSGGAEAALAVVSTGEGRRLMEAARASVHELQTVERDILRVQSLAADASSRRLDRSALLTVLATTLLIFASYIYMRRSLLAQAAETARMAHAHWLKGGAAELASAVSGVVAMRELGERALDFFARYLEVQVGTLYAAVSPGRLVAAAGYAGGRSVGDELPEVAAASLAGEVARRGLPVRLRDLPADYVKVSSTLGSTTARDVVLLPCLFEGEVVAVAELGRIEAFSPAHMELLERASEALGIAVATARSRARLQESLEETQRQAEELQAQQEELRAANEELESQAHALQRSQEELEVQQEELRRTNEELAQQAQNLEGKADELERASRYKSEFLANMSHELRTPLNSLLLLATLLSENREKNLTPKQLEFAQTIYKSGSDLLALISDILDLSKVEAGKLRLDAEDVDLAALAEGLERTFRPMAEAQGLAFELSLAPDLPPVIVTDGARVEQILKNLLSNAVKFTPRGVVRLAIERRGGGLAGIACRVTDTGVGIRREDFAAIFEAFQQADGSTSRAYGGTGLGLTISRELAQLLGGSIELESAVGQGSTFTLFLPEAIAGAAATPRAAAIHPALAPHAAPAAAPAQSAVVIDEADAGDKLALIIEDDPDFGRVLVAHARESGYRTALATSAEAGLEVARTHRVDAILLDLKLPDASGFSVLERLKADRRTRAIPVHVVSGLDAPLSSLRLGAVGFLKKPVSRAALLDAFRKVERAACGSVRKILVVEDDATQREAIRELLGNVELRIDGAGSAAEALAKLDREPYDCVVLDMRLPDMSGFELLEELERRPLESKPPVVVYTGKDLSRAELDRLELYAESIILKGARSPERLLDEISLFLHRVEAKLPPSSQELLDRLRADAGELKGRRILVVDDDMRNVFALVNALEASGVRAVVARNGREALAKLESDPGIELALMDVMMPEMDGLETTRRIRANPRLKRLPVIALTAKAMKGDQEQCLESGANDYLPKPVNLDRLLSLLRVWLPRSV